MQEENQKVQKKEAPRSGRRRSKKRGRYTPEVRLRAVKLHLEEGFTQGLVCREMGMCISTFHAWLRVYRERGEEGLRSLPPPGGGGGSERPRLPSPVTEKILELKRQNPWWGIKHIAQVMRRMFLLQASPETVRTKLHEAGLMNQKRPKARRNLSRPRFFERATPNQMWQTDIFTFRLGGRYAYLIAFMDDYSRFVVGADLFRSPTAQAVIEVFRVAAGEYQPPKEMLTDNGPQYATWRGTSRFEAQMKKERIIHIKSRPQHPMTLGKVERFWATIWQDFLVRAQFGSFDEARERIKLWIKYYNYRKPHQGIGGLCPADRYFEIQSELRKTLEAGIQENLLEMALRGQPRAPFYMVGRMEGQSVVLRAEKGKLRLSLSDDDQKQTRELEYDLTKSNNKTDDHEQGNQPNEPDQVSHPHTPQVDAGPQLQRAGEGPGGAGGVDGESQCGGGEPGAGSQSDQLRPVAEARDGGDVAGVGEPPELGGRGGPQPAAAVVAGATAAGAHDVAAHGAAGEDPGREAGSRQTQVLNDQEQSTQSTGAGRSDPAGALRPDQRQGGGETTRSLAQDLLPVGEAGLGGHDESTGGAAAGTALETERSGAGGDEAEDRRAGSEADGGPTDGGSAGDFAGDGREPAEARP